MPHSMSSISLYPSHNSSHDSMMSIDSGKSMSIDSGKYMSIDSGPLSIDIIDSSDKETTSDLGSGELLRQIYRELEHRMEEAGVTLPPETDIHHFTTYVLLGEEDPSALKPSLLLDVLADLQLPNDIISWYWEEAFNSILLLHNKKVREGTGTGKGTGGRGRTQMYFLGDDSSSFSRN